MLHHYLVQSATIGTVPPLQHLTGAGTPWFNNFSHESIANAHALFAQHTTVLAKTAKYDWNLTLPLVYLLQSLCSLNQIDTAFVSPRSRRENT
jgi:hypothetical protein